MLAPFPPISGGMSTLAAQLAERLAQDGHTVARVNLGSGRAGALTIPALYARMLVSIIRSEIVHIVSASGLSLIWKDLPALVLSFLARKRTVLHFVGGGAAESAADWGWFKRLPFRLASVVVVPTKLFRDLLIDGRIEANFAVIPHSVDIDPFLKATATDRVPAVLLGAKGLQEYSGFDQLLDAFKAIRAKRPDAALWIAGDGPCRPTLEHRVEQEGIQGVIFLGTVDHDQMPALMQQASLFVHASRYESFGIVLVEAMAAGLPVVAYSVGGIPEVVRNGESGFLIPYGDTGLFASKVLALLDGVEVGLQGGRSLQEISHDYHWDTIREHWHRVYEELVSDADQPGRNGVEA